MTAPTPSSDYAALKSGGCIASELLPKIAAVAKKYGRGEVRLTARAGIEIRMWQQRPPGG
jgi:dissimilatory sulfite reductase (desulfoviridin) alpha/beta subunit